MFTTITIIGAIVVAVGWIAYGIWVLIERRREAKEPGSTRPVSEKKQEFKSSIADYAKKLAEFEKPPYKGKDKKE